MSDLETAIVIAAQAHKGQKRRNGLPYLLHPLRVMLRMTTEEEMIVAVLHDIVEDTKMTLSDLRDKGFSESVLNAVELLTTSDGGDYDDYLNALVANPLARKVKIADLLDNMNVAELPDLQEKDLARLKKYHKALRRLENVEA